MKTIVLMMTFLTLFGCQGFGQSAKPGEPFTLKLNESAKIEGIEITVNRIGRKWLAKGGGETLDFTFTVKYDGKTQSYSNPVPELIMAGDYKVEVVKTEPFGYGYAIFVVTKYRSEMKDAAEKEESKDSSKKENDRNGAVAAKFVEQFGWHLDESISPVKIDLEFPPNFDGLPFNLYQSAAQRSGIDMTPLLGKKVEMLRFTLREKQNEGGKDFEIFAHLIIENGKVVGAWRTDSSARAPGIYSFVKKKT
jgi:hypothetical protein